MEDFHQSEQELAVLDAEVMRRQNALTHVLDYIEFMKPSMLPDFEHTPADHHILLAHELDKMADPDDPQDRLAVSEPPGSAKSFYCSIVFPTFMLAKFPSKKWLCLNNTETLAEDFAHRRRQILRSAQWKLLAQTELMPDAQALAKQLTWKGGGIYCAGAGSTITGFRADGVFSDDLITGHEQAASLSQLDKLWNWYISEARSRLKPSIESGAAREGLEMQIATRWHLQDPIGRVVRLTRDGFEDWKYIRIPMLADSADDPLGRKLGERLWKNYFTERMVRDAQRSPLIWVTLYQQKPATSEHSWCPPEHLHYVSRTEVPENCRTYIGCDIALSDAKGDFTVFVVIDIDEEGIYWIKDLIRMRNYDKITSQYLALCVQYKPFYSWVEDDNPSKIWFRMVTVAAGKAKIASKLLMSKIKNVEKEVRAAPLRDLFFQNRVRIVTADWNEALALEIGEFPGGRHDDMIDAIGVVAKELHKNVGPVPSTALKEPKVIEGSFQVVEGQTVTRQNVKELFALNVGRRRRRRI